MPVLSITHKGKIRGKYELFSDGQSIGLISNGETREIEVSVGQHTIEARILEARSKMFSYSIYAKERKSIVVFPNRVSSTFLLIAVLNFVFAIFLLSGILKPEGSYYMLFFFILLLSFYFLRIRRNNYIVIKEC